ncbi:4-alpha-glucanotransferase [Allostella vacuolata]|nr:4-alpha-glucanotransferase [Stella vacuolata]
MSDALLRDLARRAGIHTDWTDYRGTARSVAPATLRHILAAMALPADSPGDIARSLHRLDDAAAGHTAPPLVTADAGKPVALPVGEIGASRGQLILEDGSRRDVVLDAGPEGRPQMAAIAEPGYHRLIQDHRETVLAVAPPRCFGIADIAPRRRPWGLAAQIYGVRRRGDGGIGDLGGVAVLAEAAARHGADLLALSPCHALFAAEPGRAGPYSPSSRLFLNVLHGDPSLVLGQDRVAGAIAAAGVAEILERCEPAGLIDWAHAGAARLEVLRALFDALDGEPEDCARFRRHAGPALEDHARFEALHAAERGRGGEWSWRRWPEPLRDATSPAVAAFAAEHAREVAFHAFLQWIAHRSREAAQRRAREAGMRIGLMADLAVGMDGDGSHAWSRPGDVMTGLAVGAPPDLINGVGQNWGLTTFSPPALVTGGFAPFLATLRAAMRDAGGVRIDHVMGLARLWLVPEGASATDGAYITYPVTDLLRLVALESHRHRAIVVGEDLGTVEPAFRRQLDRRGVHGMRVLWFEKDERGFLPPAAWTRDAAAMTTTHDLPTVAGWWLDSDIRLRGAIAGRPDGDPAELADRADARAALWRAFQASGAAAGPPPPAGPPATDQVVDAAIRHVARARSRLMILPVEDALGLGDQPNLPGTIDEHPNWRRRLPTDAGQVLDAAPVAARLRTIQRERTRR